jgi:hypothetical protein
MNMKQDSHFPVRSDLKLIYLNTLILAVLLTAVSLAGILFPDKIYQSRELQVAFVPNDLLNLCVGLPMILGSLFLTKRKKLIGLLSYPGALFYLSYVYGTYLLGLPFQVLFLPYLLLLTLSIYTLIGLTLSIDSQQVREMLGGRVPIKTSGAIVFALACLLLIYQCYQMLHAAGNAHEVDQMMTAQWTVDFLLASPPALIVGMCMIRGRPLGYSMGMALLLVFSILFLGLIPIMVLQGHLGDALDIVAVAGSSLICIVPLILFAKGIINA